MFTQTFLLEETDFSSYKVAGRAGLFPDFVTFHHLKIK